MKAMTRKTKTVLVRSVFLAIAFVAVIWLIGGTRGAAEASLPAPAETGAYDPADSMAEFAQQQAWFSAAHSRAAREGDGSPLPATF